jgi:prevent-host-death family protein
LFATSVLTPFQSELFIDLLSGLLTGVILSPESIVENRFMSTKFSEDVVPLTDLKTNPGRIVKHVAEVHRPVLLTSRGRGVAVVQSVVDYEEAQEERAFMRAVVEGLADIEAGREVSIEEAKRRLGLS